MLLKQTPLTFFEDISVVDMHLRIYSDNNYYKAELQICGIKPQRFRIGLTSHDVEELNAELQQAIEDITNKVGEDNEAGLETLIELATIGKSAFNRIFSEGSSREIIQKALEILEVKTVVTIEISSENFFIPWEILYQGSLATFDISNFWGMRYIIARTLIQDNRPGDMVSPIIQASCPEVGLVACKELEYVSAKEIPALEKLHQNKLIRLSCLHALNVEQRSKSFKEFGHFLRGNLHIVHFACHAYVKIPHDRSCLYISDQFDITIQDFYAHEFKIACNPLIILNACRTGTNSPLYTSNWAALFWEYGARGVLATEFRVPDWFAAAFIEELYKCLLAGKPIGECLWHTRHHFWEKERNLLGLAYALYSPLSIKLVKAN